MRLLIFENKNIKLLIIFLISLIALYFTFRGENLSELSVHLNEVRLGEIILATVILIGSCVIRAYRLQLLIAPFEKISLHDAFSATMIGYFGNSIFAFRIGELLKAYSVSKRSNSSFMEIFGTVIIERLIDTISLIVIFILLIPWFPFDDVYIRISIFTFVFVALVFSIIIIISVKAGVHKKLINKQNNKGNIIFRASSFLGSLLKGTTTLNRTKYKKKIIVSSFMIWVAYFFQTFIIVRACNLGLGAIDVGILLVLGSIAIGIPALPGSVGTYDAGIKYSLIFIFGISNDAALSYALVSHSIAYFPLSIIGFFYFIFADLKLKDVKRIKLNEKL